MEITAAINMIIFVVIVYLLDKGFCLTINIDNKNHICILIPSQFYHKREKKDAAAYKDSALDKVKEKQDPFSGTLETLICRP
jgi:hypothetical protein